MSIPRRFPWIEDSRLWLVLDREAALPRSLPEATRLCIEGGVDVVMFRMKDATAQVALPVAQQVRRICKDLGVPFVLAHFVELVPNLMPEAVHLGLEDCTEENQRKMIEDIQEWGANGIALGWSAHSVYEAWKLTDGEGLYAFLGPIFNTPSKLLYGEPLGLGAVAEAQSKSGPIVFIGGMNEQTIPLAVQAGSKRVAAISALLSVPDPRVAAQRLKALLPA